MGSPDRGLLSGRPIERIGIVGAGFAGLTAARYLKEFGFETVIFEKDDQAGGVWASSRRYPGLRTQNGRDTYALSDFPYPKGYPEWPTGEQVQEYFDAYVEAKNLGDDLRLNTEVTRAEPQDGGGWKLEIRDTRSGAEESEEFDYLIVANGIFCDPFIPPFEGIEEFEQAGGRVCHTTQIHDPAEVAGKRVIVVGYGKSACDVATTIAPETESTTVVARKLIWKMPRRLVGGLNYKYLLLTRLGEGLFPYFELRGFDRFLHGVGKPIRNGMVGSLQSMVANQLDLDELGLRPDMPLDTIVRSTVSLASSNFYEQIKNGELAVERDTEIVKLEPGKAHLSNGKVLEVDTIICGTGFHQRVPFFSEELHRKVTDADGNFRLYRQILPLEVPDLAFAGYNSSFLSQLNCEVGALWIAALITGRMELPPMDRMQDHITRRLAWMDERADGEHSRGTNIIPFSMHNVDELLSDIDLRAGSFTRFKEWMLPINPKAYSELHRKLKKQPVLVDTEGESSRSDAAGTGVR